MNPKKDFYIKAGKPVHTLSYCAFLDVLGFSARTRESYLDGSHDSLLQEFHETFAQVTAELKKQTTSSPLYYKSFSDNVLLAVPRYSSDMESEFGNILIATSEYQFQMALKGFFVRGGLSVGPLFIDDNSVYGEALIAAYELESKVAVNPIVVLSDDTAKLVNKHLTYYAGEWAPQRRSLLVNSDDRYFINYLDECILETYEGWELDIESLSLHRDRIQYSLAKYAEKPSVFAKFSWLSAYHNYFCDTVADYLGYSDELKVNSELMTVKFRRLPE
jgi:hypothetical protein